MALDVARRIVRTTVRLITKTRQAHYNKRLANFRKHVENQRRFLHFWASEPMWLQMEVDNPNAAGLYDLFAETVGRTAPWRDRPPYANHVMQRILEVLELEDPDIGRRFLRYVSNVWGDNVF